MVLTLFAGRGLGGFGNPTYLVKGTTFTDLDDFQRFMWQKVDSTDSIYGMANEPVAEPSDEPEGVWRAICDENGVEVYTYYQRNWSVSHITYGDSEDNYLPITVYTDGDMRTAHARARIIAVASYVLCAIECAVGIAVYLRRREPEAEN